MSAGDDMITLDLGPEEAEVLREVLDSYLSDLRMEMADTDRKDFRDRLKERRNVIEKTITALTGQEPR